MLSLKHHINFIENIQSKTQELVVGCGSARVKNLEHSGWTEVQFTNAKAAQHNARKSLVRKLAGFKT